MRTATFQFSESGGSVNGPNLFTELPFLSKSLPNPSFTELPPRFSLKSPLGRCPSTLRPVFPVSVFQLSKQQNRTQTTSSTVLGTLRTVLGQGNSPKKSFEAVAFVSWALNWESTGNWDFHSLEPYTKPYSDTS